MKGHKDPPENLPDPKKVLPPLESILKSLKEFHPGEVRVALGLIHSTFTRRDRGDTIFCIAYQIPCSFWGKHEYKDQAQIPDAYAIGDLEEGCRHSVWDTL